MLVSAVITSNSNGIPFLALDLLLFALLHSVASGLGYGPTKVSSDFQKLHHRAALHNTTIICSILRYSSSGVDILQLIYPYKFNITTAALLV